MREPERIDRGALRRSQRHSRRLARSHYENFLVASVLLPRSLRQPFFDVYAYCRTADDLADESPSPDVALERLAALEQDLEATFSGKPPGGWWPALAETIRRFGLPREPFLALLSAFRQDQRVFRYRDEEQLRDYCTRSANPVGHLVLHLGGCYDATNAALADRICTALQLANFWQDIARDRTIGRVYLPADAMRRHGVEESMLAAGETPERLRRLLAEQCDRTEALFREGLPLADRVPRWLAADIKLFAHGGLATLEAIRRIDYDVLRRRPTVSRWRQLRLVMRAATGRL